MSILPVILYVITAAAYLFLSLRMHRLSNLTKIITQVPENERMNIIKAEIGTAQTKGITAKQFLEQQQSRIRLIMQPLVSLTILVAALYIILSDRFSPQDKHWAYGAVGTVIGFWLKG